MAQAVYKKALSLVLALTIGGTSASAQEAQVFSVFISESYHAYSRKLIVREAGKAELYDSSNKLVGKLTEVKKQQIGGNNTCIFYMNSQYSGCLITGARPISSFFTSRRQAALPVAKLDEALDAAKRGNKEFAVGFYQQAQRLLEEQRDEYNSKEQALLQEINKQE